MPFAAAVATPASSPGLGGTKRSYQWELMAGYTSQQFAAGATTYMAPAGSFFPFAAEVDAQWLVRDPFIFDKLWIYQFTNGTNASSTLKVRKNGANVNGLVTLTAAVADGEYKDSTGSDIFLPGDLFSLQFINGGGGTINSHVLGGRITSLVVPGGRDFTWPLLNSDNASTTPQGITAYGPMAPGGLAGGLTEAPWQLTARTAMTLRNMRHVVRTNTLNVSETARMRKNTANGNGVNVHTAGLTGGVEDQVNSDLYVPGDVYDFSIVTGAGSGSSNSSRLDWACQGKRRPMISWLGFSLAFANTIFGPLEGEWHTPGITANEARVSQVSRGYRKISHLQVVAGANTTNANTVVTFRKNGANTALTVTIAAGGTTLVEDVTNTILVAPGDTINCQIDTTASASGNFNKAMIAVDDEPL